MSDQAPALAWDASLAAYLGELSETQTDLLAHLESKRRALLDSDTAALESLGEPEQRLVERLQCCLDRRGELLTRAAGEGLPADSLRSLHAALGERSDALRPRLAEAALKSRLLRHHSLTNWVLTQRTLIHLTNILEILATGGRMKPTYDKRESSSASGSLVDHAA